VSAYSEEVPERGHQRLHAGVLAEQHEGGKVGPRVGGELGRREAVVPEDPDVKPVEREAEAGLERGGVDAHLVRAHRRRRAGSPPQVLSADRSELVGHAMLAAQSDERVLASQRGVGLRRRRPRRQAGASGTDVAEEQP